MMQKILSKKTRQKTILLGNEAIVRGALEAGVQFAATYPGTPASEIGNTFYKIAKSADVYFEFSVNEKLALEAVIGASFSGLKSLVAMKNFGLNVASDALIPFCYTGAKGPAVIVAADDPSCHSSAQSEQNSRPFGELAHIPILEPADPQECLCFTKKAFLLSQTFKIPIMLRLTTRVAHQKMPVKFGLLPKKQPLPKEFIKDTKHFVTMPPRVLEMKKELFEKIEKIALQAEKDELNYILSPASNSKIGIITSGVSFLYVKEAIGELGLNLPVLKLGFFYPLPEKKIADFIKNRQKILVVEELEPMLEKEIERIAKKANPGLQIFGKNVLSAIGELTPTQVLGAVAKLTNKKIAPGTPPTPSSSNRFPQFCAGCPYWLVFGAVRKAMDEKKVVFGGDIGCYMLAGLPPHNLQDYLLCMGSSIGIGHGIKKALEKSGDQKLIAFVGDSTFIHAGIPALINTVFNKSNPLIIILENETTAMTGYQPHPAQKSVNIEKIVRACGVKNCRTINPIRQSEFIKTIQEFLNKKEVSVIIAKQPCPKAKKNEQE